LRSKPPTRFSRAFASRITTNIRELKGYTYSPFSQLESHPGQADWVETADVTTNVTGASIKEIFFEIDRLRKEAPSAAELQGSRTTLPASSVSRTPRAPA
jgi:hypothetical protein